MSRNSRFVGAATIVAMGLSVLTPVSGQAATCPQGSRARVVVKVDPVHDDAIGQVASRFPVEISDSLVPSRGIWEVRSTDPGYCESLSSERKLAEKMKADPEVLYVEASYLADLDDTRFHAWGASDPVDAGTDSATWRTQSAATTLRLGDVHRQDTGRGSLVAVLDTGVDASHPSLKGVLVPGWDYVDDDDRPAEVRNGTDDDGDHAVDEAFGHGTFISGIVTLVAPSAKVMPMRVLDSDGRGNTFVVAQAIEDAVAAGADVISMSFGTARKPDSTVFEDAIKLAERAGVVVVAAAGNAGSNVQQYPAATADVVGVGALTADASRLTTFSGSGGWVDVAAPGERVAGPVPGGRYVWWNGTSVAVPFVSGQLALLASQRHAAKAHDLVDRVRHSSRAVKPKGLPKTAAIDILKSLANH